MGDLRSVGEGGNRPEGKGKRREAGEGFDPWETENPVEYKPERLYTRSTNKHDHSVKTDLRIPPSIHAIVGAIVDKVPGYRSIADFHRDAIVHRMKWWMDRDMELPPFMQHQRNMELWLADLEQLKLMLDLSESLTATNRELLERASQGKNPFVLSKTIQGVEERAEEMGEPYDEQLRELAREYRQKLRKMN